MRGRRFVPAGLLAALVLVLAPSAGAVGTYTDATGDGNGAPDIQKVTVTNGVGGQILIDVTVDSLPSPADVQTLVALNTDMSAGTGAPDSGGADYYFVVDESDSSYGFAHWNGANWEGAPYTTVGVRTSSNRVSISVNRSELGNTDGFYFWVRTRAGDPAANHSDDAPDDGAWNYSLQANGPDVQGFSVTTRPPAGPKGGKLFTIIASDLKLPPSGDPFQRPAKPESYSCQAKLAGKPLVGTGTGGCTWKLPKKARGKKLVVVVTVSYQGVKKSLPFTYRVS
jgi:hypothetical protein